MPADTPRKSRKEVRAESEDRCKRLKRLIVSWYVHGDPPGIHESVAIVGWTVRRVPCDEMIRRLESYDRARLSDLLNPQFNDGLRMTRDEVVQIWKRDVPESLQDKAVKAAEKVLAPALDQLEDQILELVFEEIATACPRILTVYNETCGRALGTAGRRPWKMPEPEKYHADLEFLESYFKKCRAQLESVDDSERESLLGEIAAKGVEQLSLRWDIPVQFSDDAAVQFRNQFLHLDRQSRFTERVAARKLLQWLYETLQTFRTGEPAKISLDTMRRQDRED